jgi:hypothetical protein
MLLSKGANNVQEMRNIKLSVKDIKKELLYFKK